MMAWLAAPTPGRADVTYRITDLGTLGGTFSKATALNDDDQVTGVAFTANYDLHAFLYDPSRGTGMTDLGTLGGSTSWGFGLNDAGVVVGYSQVSSGDQHGFAKDTAGVHPMTDLGTAGLIQASGINNPGTVVGFGATSQGKVHAYTVNGTTRTDLGVVAGDAYSYGNAINAGGLAVGYSAKLASGSPNSNAFLYDGSQTTKMINLGNLGGTYSAANAINDGNLATGHAQVTGYSYLAGNTTQHAFLSDYVPGQAGSMKDLGTLAGDNSSVGLGIDDLGQVVGYSWSTVDTIQHAFLYDNGRMLDLNDLIAPTSGWTLTWAADINNNGLIVGWGTHDGQTRAFLLTPIRAVPEPASLAILATGAALVAAGAARRRRSRR
jgi:probable HAF family extracellular repeat protein